MGKIFVSISKIHIIVLSTAAEFTSEKPYFVTPLSNAMGRAGQRVKLECETKGNPMPTLTWYHDGRPVEESMNLKVMYSFDN